MSESEKLQPEIYIAENKFPYCVVFAYLPCVSTFLPFIGHVGICTSNGTIHDFAGSYTIFIDNMQFSDPMKYWKLDRRNFPIATTDEIYDNAIRQADEEFSKRKHNIILNNCHHYVAMALNNLRYRGRTDWTAFKVFLNLILFGRFVSWKSFLVLYGPFTLVLVLLSFMIYTLAA